MKLFIGNVSYDTPDSELRALFEDYEPVLEFVRPTDRETGRPRGFAFVTLKDDEQGLGAIEKLDGHEIDGRKLRVNEAEERSPRAPQQRYRSTEEDITSGDAPRVDDRPTDKKGNKVVYKSI
ncbi:MAG: RNA-binding protein [Verrucomicrobiales bacterium]|nr:RNA-binding protein [Verrucomicrobiales bacterium]